MNDQLKSILEQQLRDAQTPDAVNWWPFAIGWWALIAVLTIALILAARALYQRHQRNLYRNTAAKELDTHFVVWQELQINSGYLQAANSILKRTCSHFSDDATPLSGDQWLAYLNAHSKTSFSAETETALAQQLYQKNSDSDISKIHAEIQIWLANHTADRLEKSAPTRELTHA
jgi:hypothetical protein